jgi:hypothetical protein
MSRPTHDSTNACTIDDLETVLADQQEITTAMAALIDRQRQLVESGDAEGLLTLLGDRQGLVDRLIASQDALSETLAAVERSLPAADKVRKSRIEAALEAIQARLADVMERDRQDQAQLEHGRKQTRSEMGQIDVMHKAHAAYGRGPGKASRFADHRG